MNGRRWPRSLLGQMLLAVALALLFAQGIGGLLLYRAQEDRLRSDLAHAGAYRVIAGTRVTPAGRPQPGGWRGPPAMRGRLSPLQPGEPRDGAAERELTDILREQGVTVAEAVVTTRRIADDPTSLAHLAARRPHAARLLREGRVMIAGVRLAQGDWVIARVFIRPEAMPLIWPVLWQTLLIYLVVVGAIALILRRINRPLAALTRRLEDFAATRSPDGLLAAEGPDDVRRLIEAYNAMEARIAALLDEKDLMLGAIGHDLKTPLAALRVRIESVDDEAERARMAGTIDDIARTLDDILSLARVGRPSDAVERTELSALAATVVEEFEDMGAPVALGDTVRIAASVRPTWLRRALRNLIGNAVRYGRTARVTLARESAFAVVRIDDDGPGIAEGQIGAMMDPFRRGEASRNSETGGAGLGLALARAIAEQHGGALRLCNRRDPDGRIAGLTAELRLPLT